MKNLETGLDYANTDPSLHFNRVERTDERWRGAWIWCLRHQDYDSAELIASRNVISDECAGGAHDDCHFLWCRCSHHSAVQFELERPLKSPREVASEIEAEMEDAA